MASAKDLKKKIKSISNTKKITRTMEMVAAAKSKQTQKRVESNTPYSSKLRELLESVCAAGGSLDHYLLRAPERVEKNALLVISANRGLCGGYNTNVLTQAEKWIRAEKDDGRDTDVFMVGKKGIARFRFRRIAVAEPFTNIDDKSGFREAEAMADMLMARFRRGEVGRVMALSTRYLSASTQRPALVQLLPIVPPQGGDGDGRAGADFLFEPDPTSILSSLLPYAVRSAVYRIVVEAVACEQIARRVAMKLATDNAEELIKTYTRKYNRQRQAGITQQITEIVGGAEVLQ